MELSTKPYLLRAIHDWCTDAGFTPYIAVAVDDSVRVPVEFVKNGEIVLNISSLATSRLQLGNEAIEFRARFGGAARDVFVPIGRVVAIYARENGQGMAFDVPRGAQAGAQPAGEPAPAPVAANTLRAVVETARDRQALVPVAPAMQSPVVQSPAVESPAGSSEPRPPPRPGDRPKLTRVK